jgi:hypothetical protein
MSIVKEVLLEPVPASTVDIRLRASKRWGAIDMVMHAITVAIHLAHIAGLAAISDGLCRLHQDAQRERDRL